MALVLPLETLLRFAMVRTFIPHTAFTHRIYWAVSVPVHWVFLLAILTFLMLHLVIERKDRLQFLKWMSIAAVTTAFLISFASAPIWLMAHGGILGCCIAMGIGALRQTIRFGIWLGLSFLGASFVSHAMGEAGLPIPVVSYLTQPTGDPWNPTILQAFVFGAIPVFLAAQWLARSPTAPPVIVPATV